MDYISISSEEEEEMPSKNKVLMRMAQKYKNLAPTLLGVSSHLDSSKKSKSKSNSRKKSRSVLDDSDEEFSETEKILMDPRNRDVDERLSDLTAERLQGMAEEYLKELDVLRVKCRRIQGDVSKKMKLRFQLMSEITAALYEKAMKSGDVPFLEGQIQRLRDDSRVRMEERCEALKQVDSLRKKLNTCKIREKKAIAALEQVKAVTGQSSSSDKHVDKTTKSGRMTRDSNNREERDVSDNPNSNSNRIYKPKPNLNSIADSGRAANSVDTKEVESAKYVTVRELDQRDQRLEQRLEQHHRSLEERMEVLLLKMMSQSKREEFPPLGPLPQGPEAVEGDNCSTLPVKQHPRVIEIAKVNLPPSRFRRRPTEKGWKEPVPGVQGQDRDTESTAMGSDSAVEDGSSDPLGRPDSRLRSRKKRKRAAIPGEGTPRLADSPQRGTPAAKMRRAPKSAAVVIRITNGSVQYSDVLKKARENVSLADLGIKGTQLRNAANGGLIIEVPGEDKEKKAEALRERLQLVLEGEARVSRPTIRGEAKLIGVDVSLSPLEIRTVLASEAKAAVEEIEVTPVWMTGGGRTVIWVRSTLAVINRLVSLGRVAIGWDLARIKPY